MTFFLTYKREDRLVFAREVTAEDSVDLTAAEEAQRIAKLAMIHAGQATWEDFDAGKVRLTSLAEMPEGVRPFALTKEYEPGEKGAAA